MDGSFVPTSLVLPVLCSSTSGGRLIQDLVRGNTPADTTRLSYQGVEDGEEPHVPIKDWYAGFDAFATQAKHVLDTMAWMPPPKPDTQH